MSTARHKPTPDSEHQGDSCPRCGAEGGGACGGPPSDHTDAGDRPVTTEQRIAELEKAVADAQEQRLRLIAEYQTSQRRALESEARARAAGIAQAVRQVIPVIDNLDLALGQTASMSMEKAVEGLTMLHAELNKSLEKNGVERIEPKPGDDFDPHQHEAVMRQPSEGVERDQISMIFQSGYRLGETVIRPAKVAVAP